jgi:hypothetical protein
MSTSKQAMSDIQATKKPAPKKAVSRKMEASNSRGNASSNDEQLVDEVKN